MAFIRNILPLGVPDKDELTSNLAGIGMHFAAKPNYQANIEDTIYFASIDGMEKNDFRTLAVMTHWIHFYSRLINVDRLTRIVALAASDRVRAYWSAVAIWKKKDPRFLRLSRLYKGPRIELLETGSEYLYEKYGESKRFRDTPLRLPESSLRQRDMDVIPIQDMQKHNRFLRYRILVGPINRADMWALLDLEPGLTAYKLAKRTYGSLATAWMVKRDWGILHGKKAQEPEGNLA